MIIKMFNFWYFLWIAVVAGAGVGLYYLLNNKTDKTKKIVLLSILFFAIVLHFLKCFIPPYSTNQGRLYSDIFFINICAANICLFPIMFISKSNIWKDYMFYLGLLGGGLAVLYPIEPLLKTNPAEEVLDVIRFYIHHGILLIVPLLMVALKLHTISYKRVWAVPGCLLVIMLFIMLNQIIQSEIGFVSLRGDDIFKIGYKNSSYIWGPDDDIGYFIANFCPELFKTLPVGEFAGQEKYWPWVWLVVPAYLLLTPIAFLIAAIVDFKRLKKDLGFVRQVCKERMQK